MIGFTATSPFAASVASARVYEPVHLIAMAAAALIVWRGVETERLIKAARQRAVPAYGVLVLFCFAIVVLSSQAENPFLYFQF